MDSFCIFPSSPFSAGVTAAATSLSYGGSMAADSTATRAAVASGMVLTVKKVSTAHPSSHPVSSPVTGGDSSGDDSSGGDDASTGLSMGALVKN